MNIKNTEGHAHKMVESLSDKIRVFHLFIANNNFFFENFIKIIANAFIKIENQFPKFMI